MAVEQSQTPDVRQDFHFVQGEDYDRYGTELKWAGGEMAHVGFRLGKQL